MGGRSLLLVLLWASLFLTVNAKKVEKRDTGAQESFHHKTEKLWLDGIIHYMFNETGDKKFDDGEKFQIQSEMDLLTSRMAPGCIQFLEVFSEKELPVNHTSFISINAEHEQLVCRCDLGRKEGNSTQLFLAEKACFEAGTPVHEITHALGATHEQCRPDRDYFIDVLFENLVSSGDDADRVRKQYEIEKKLNVTGETPYDFFSNLHYHRSQGQEKDSGKPTMRIKPEFEAFFRETIGSNPLDKKYKEDHPYPSITDIVEISKNYNCSIHPDVKEQYLWYAYNITNILVDSVMKCVTAGRGKTCFDPNPIDKTKGEYRDPETKKKLIDKYVDNLLVELDIMDQIELDIFEAAFVALDEKWEQLKAEDKELTDGETESGTEDIEE